MSLVGRQIGRYRILEQVGHGGMSVVYRGLDTSLEREVAVKVLHPHLAARPESRRRLEREAKAVARLKHPAILEVFDYATEGEGEGGAFIVTEFIRGKTLREVLTDEPFAPPELAAMVVHELAGALNHAHQAGVLHRDVKPENVMVRHDGALKLMDFGIAKLLDREERMTVTGALVGSPAHMAPEIIEGEEAGAAADVFSLGTVLYLLATGRLPFVAPNTTATLKKILDCAYPDPQELVPSVSDELKQIIARCLDRQPGRRYPSAGPLQEALAQLLTPLGLVPVNDELSRFFADPRGARRALTARLVARRLEQAEALVRDRKLARAVSALDLVLALEPGHSRANALLEQLSSHARVEKKRRRTVRWTVTAAVALPVILAGAAWATRSVKVDPDGAGAGPSGERSARISASTPSGRASPAVARPGVAPQTGARDSAAGAEVVGPGADPAHGMESGARAAAGGQAGAGGDPLAAGGPGGTGGAPLAAGGPAGAGGDPLAAGGPGGADGALPAAGGPAGTGGDPLAAGGPAGAGGAPLAATPRKGTQGAPGAVDQGAGPAPTERASLAGRALEARGGSPGAGDTGPDLGRAGGSRSMPGTSGGTRRGEAGTRPDAAKAGAGAGVALASAGLEGSAVRPVPVAVVIRPFGDLQVDGQPASAEAAARHTLELAPGTHRLAVRCEYCDPRHPGVEVTIAGNEEIPLVAPLLPAQVTFEGLPPGSRIRVGAVEKSAAEAAREPFSIVMPRGGSMKMQHLVQYTVIDGAGPTWSGEAWVTPGTRTVLRPGPAR